MVAYCPGMNDPWRAGYGLRPKEMLASFRTLSAYIQYAAPNTALIWNPALGTDYPFFGSEFAPSVRSVGDENAALLDTDGDGAITMRDDPYRYVNVCRVSVCVCKIVWE
ncbi:hypothetical protein DFJ73DRAFT_331495 [Zopfochytrium polystomum]|nr:hypothetical protein DFJ73DRAFT_331495 [Zopfochytrium polystomum]